MKKFDPASSSARPVTVTLTGVGHWPRAIRSASRSGERTSSRGLSLRMVAAPTSTASQVARTPSTRSKSASLDSASRVRVALSR